MDRGIIVGQLRGRRAEIVTFHAYDAPALILATAANWLKEHPRYWLHSLNVSYQDTGIYIALTVEDFTPVEIGE